MTTPSDRPPDPVIEAHSVAKRAARLGSNDEPPRLSIAHLMLFTFCCAVYLSVVRSQAEKEPGVVGALLVCLLTLGYGAAWAGTAVLISRLWHGARYPVEPGHWFLVVLGGQAAFEVALWLLSERWFRSPAIVSAAVVACLFVVPALSRKLPAVWKALFCLLTALYGAWPLLVGWELVFDDLGWAAYRFLALFLARARREAAFLLVLGLAVWEHFRHIRRGWLHYVGVAAFLWMILVPLVFQALR